MLGSPQRLYALDTSLPMKFGLFGPAQQATRNLMEGLVVPQQRGYQQQLGRRVAPSRWTQRGVPDRFKQASLPFQKRHLDDLALPSMRGREICPLKMFTPKLNHRALRSRLADAFRG